MRRLIRGEQEQRLAVADLTTDEGLATFATLLEGLTVSIVYSDPPWNPGNEKYWRRYAKASETRGYDRLLDAWCRCVVACRPEHVLVEQSIIPAHKQMLLDAIARCTGWHLPLLEEWTVQYGSPKRPNALLHFGREKLSTDPSGMHGIGMTRAVFRGLAIRPGATVADPCMGLGMTSRVAHEFGLSCIGTELNPARLERTIATLRKLGYAEGDAPALSDGSTTLPAEERVAIYNRTMLEMRELLADVTSDPACFPQLVRAEVIEANDYNPNRTASPEMDLLEQSIRVDGITMPVVVVGDAERCTVVDGFHRRTVATDRLRREWIPCSFISSSMADRMASTVRHNRARGKHQVELMASLVKSMMGLGWGDEQIAGALGMSVEELLRLRQMTGAAKMLAANEYSRSWGLIEVQT